MEERLVPSDSFGGVDVFIHGSWDFVTPLLKKKMTKKELKGLGYPNELLPFSCKLLPSSTLYEDVLWTKQSLRDRKYGGPYELDMFNIRRAAFCLFELPDHPSKTLFDYMLCALGAKKPMGVFMETPGQRRSMSLFLSAISGGYRDNFWIHQFCTKLPMKENLKEVMDESILIGGPVYASCPSESIVCTCCGKSITKGERMVFLGGTNAHNEEIGRASCRERV